MGVGGHFWDLLKPYARTEGFDFLRDKRVAVDLSFWIVQHETAIRAYVRNPHLRLIFFRTINLFSKFGAFPVFVVDGTPSPLKSQARIIRFFRATGIDLSNLPAAEEGVSIDRNPAFQKCVQECVELLELLGMPVLKAKGEAEALCAHLNNEGLVDACITTDSDAFLYGANCIIKFIRPNSEEPFECYYMSDIEAGLGLKRKHLIAISLLVGNDHDLKGVKGIGLDSALRFVKSFTEEDVLTRLSEIGRGEALQSGMRSEVDGLPNLDENLPQKKSPHCSFCGHPGSKKAHLKLTCEYCSSSTYNGCTQKPVGFKCNCTSCNLDRRDKEKKRYENWQMKVCQRISVEQNFPNAEILEMYLSCNYCGLAVNEGPLLVWESPKTGMLVDYLSFYQNWEPSYIRQRILPMLSTIFLRQCATNPNRDLLYGQYEFDSIQRVKVRFGHQFLVVNWKKVAPMSDNTICIISDEESNIQLEHNEISESVDPFDGVDTPNLSLRDGCWFLTTDENLDLVKAAFPEKFDEFFEEKLLKETNSRRKKSVGTPQSSESPTSKSVQLSITKFFRSSKALYKSKTGENNLAEDSENVTAGSSEGKRKTSSQNLSKSARRRLLFG